MISGAGGIEKTGPGSLELDGLNTYYADVENLSVSPPEFVSGTEIAQGTVVCGSYLALGSGTALVGESGVPLNILEDGTLNLNGQNRCVTYGIIGQGGINRKGVQIGDLYGAGNVTDNSAGGGGYLDVHLDDYGNWFGTFSGQFVRGNNGQLPSMSINVGGVAGGGTDGNGNPILPRPDSLTLDGPVLDFAVFDEKANAGPGTVTIENPCEPRRRRTANVRAPGDYRKIPRWQ